MLLIYYLTELVQNAIRFINDFIDVYPYNGEKIFLCRYFDLFDFVINLIGT